MKCYSLCLIGEGEVTSLREMKEPAQDPAVVQTGLDGQALTYL